MTARGSAVGPLLRRWRAARGMSQLELAQAAEVSPRHISFVESGRARPSREMVLALAGVLGVPMREQNVLLQAAGFAAVYGETSLDAPQMAEMRRALELILAQHEPFGALACDRVGDLVMANAAFARVLRMLGGPSVAPLTLLAPPRPNTLKLLFDPAGMRPYVRNWDAVARAVLVRAHRELSGDPDPVRRALVRALLAYPGVPAWTEPDLVAPSSLVIPLEIALGDLALRFFSTVTTLGTPQDVTLQELRIESFHAADAATDATMRALAAS